MFSGNKEGMKEMSFLSTLGNALSSLFASAKIDLEAIAKYFKPMVIAGAEEIAQAALQAVLNKAPLVISGQQKFDAAVSEVVSGLGAQGKQVGIDIAMTAVQDSYAKISAMVAAHQQAAATPTVAATGIPSQSVTK
jgi:hypothetical protein